MLPSVGVLEAGDDAQQRGLAAAGRAQQRDELARGELEADVVERDEVAERLADAADFNAHGASGSWSCTPARHSMKVLTTSVTRASSASSDATAKAAAKLYSL